MLGLGLGVGKMSFFGGGISISANKCINTANEAAYSITFKNLEIGEAYTYNITDGTNDIDDGFTATDKTEVTVEDLSSFDEGDVFITLTDSEGSVVKKVKKDTVSPAGYSLTLSNPFGFPEISTQAEIEFFDLEIGATVNWNIKDAPQDEVSGSFKATATTATVTTNVSSLVDGTLRAFCTLVDPCGNAGSEAASSPITKDTVVPSGYTIRIVENPINNQNEDNVELLFESLEVGATAFWSITDGVNTIADDFTITDTEESEFVDVSTFNNGTITATLVLVDDAGNQGVIETGTTNKQVFTPSGYSVAFDEASYDGTTGLNATIDISGANLGDSYSLTITSSGGGTPIVYTGTVGSATFSISNIDLTTLNTGTGTATYFETDAFGNEGGDATDTADFVFYIYLLDVYPNATCAYSITKLRSAYNGACIRVRRSTDNAEQDIGFVNNELDTASLLAFVGAGSGFVTTIYDQTTGGNDFTSTTSTRQAIIVNAGVLVTLGGRAVLDRQAVNTGYISNLNFIADTNVYGLHYIGRVELTPSSQIFCMIGSLSGGGDYGYIANRNNTGTLVHNLNVPSNEKINGINPTYTNIGGAYSDFDKHFILSAGHQFNNVGTGLALGYRFINPGMLSMYMFQALVLHNDNNDQTAINDILNQIFNIY
jgi:hypothetical protein